MLSSSTASKLDDLVGLRTAKTLVLRLAAGNAGIHAVLLYGPKGAGKANLAQVIAQQWLCASPTEDGADGTCRACTAFGRGNSPDIHSITPGGKSRLIPVTAVVNSKPTGDDPFPLITFLRTPPIYSRHKVVVMHEADRMNGPASNALLKTLEEPPSYAKLLLTTESVGSILPTILSRCLAVACEAPTEQELTSKFPDATLGERRIAQGTAGRLSTVLSRRDFYGRLIHFAEKLSTRGPREALAASEEFQSIVERIHAPDSSVRAANAEALDALALYFARDSGCPPSWTQQIIEAHRRIVANGGGSIVLDALFTSLLASTRS